MPKAPDAAPMTAELPHLPKGQKISGYPDYLDDPDGLERFRQGILDARDRHDMAPVNFNSLARLIDTIERLRLAATSSDRARGGEAETLTLRPMDTAPKDASEILLSIKAKSGSPAWIVAHWAEDLSGEEQPPYRGWFVRNPYGFREKDVSDVLGWLPLPENRPWHLAEQERRKGRAEAAEQRALAAEKERDEARAERDAAIGLRKVAARNAGAADRARFSAEAALAASEQRVRALVEGITPEQRKRLLFLKPGERKMGGHGADWGCPGLIERVGVNHPTFGSHYQLTALGVAMRALLPAADGGSGEQR